MKTVKFTKQMSWIDSGIWIENNQNLIHNPGKIEIDMSGIVFIQSNLFAYVLYMFYKRKKLGLETIVNSPSAPLMKSDFKKAGVC